MVAAAEAAANESMSSALQQAVLQQETAAAQTGGGGHGGGHNKAAIDAITRIAAVIGAKPTQRVKTVAERQAEIEKMKREAQQNPQQRDLTDERPPDKQKQAYEQNPLLALF